MKVFAAAALALSAAVIGVWAQAFPHAFWSSFPLPGHPWVKPLGAYDEHLVRDLGGLYLGLCAVSVWAVVRPVHRRVAGVAWTLFSVPHLLFHVFDRDPLPVTSQVGSLVALGVVAVLGVVLVLP